jgi:hypothetical protein
VSVAVGQPALAPDPTWTALDTISPTLVAEYTIERGRQFELDRCDTGRATVTINDRTGTLAGVQIEPLNQVALARRNPITGAWETRFRGFVEELDYTFHPSQRVNQLQLSLVDIFEIVSTLEMHPGQFGDPPPTESVGQVFFEDNANTDHTGMQIRVNQVLGNAGIPVQFYVCFSGNIAIQETVYSPGESAMTAIHEAADAEFPAVSNVYGDRYGRLAVHGRYARFDPEGTAATTTPDKWDFHSWKAGDGAAVTASPADTAHIREFSKNRGLAKLINRALASPRGIKDEKVNGQFVQNAGSIASYGIRPWTAQELLTKWGATDALNANAETRKFADYYVTNYAAPTDRPSAIGFRSMHPSAVGAAANWDLLCRCDISDRVTVTARGAGGAGMVAVPFFIEGIHEESRPLQPVSPGVPYGLDDVTMTLDLSPGGFYSANPFPPLGMVLAEGRRQA